MADQTPLLKNKPTATIDDTIESCIGNTGFCQLLQAVLVALACAFDAQQTFVNVFTDAGPSWHCNGKNDSRCWSATSPCGLPEGSWSWTQSKQTSIVSEWNLQCSPSAVVSMPTSAYFLGCVIGGLVLATLADSRLGRKNMLVVSCFTMSLTAALAALSPNIWAYAALRFVCGLARATIGTSSIVLSTEIVGKRWRERISSVCFLFFTLGFLSLPGIALLNRGSSWRTIYLWTSLPSLCYAIFIYFIVNESPRWLLVRGRKDEAINTLKNIANSNGYIINSSFSNIWVAEETGNREVFSALKILLEKRWVFKRLSAVMVIMLGIGVAYYGLPLNVGNLGSNLYMSVTLNALAELPSSLITFFFIERIDRRTSLMVFATISAITSIACAFLTANGWQMAVEVVSFFSACSACNVLLVYCIELFPTCVRNTAMSLARQALVFGGVCAPLLVAEGRKRSFMSFGVFGLVIGCCGLFTVCLPETRGSAISDTIEEEEYKGIASSNMNA